MQIEEAHKIKIILRHSELQNLKLDTKFTRENDSFK